MAPRELHELGCRYVPADRHRFGLVLSFPVTDNSSSPATTRAPFARGIVRNDAAIDGRADERIAEFDIRTPSANVTGRTAVGRQPAEGRGRARVRPRPEAAGPRPADPRPRRGQHRVHPRPGRSPSATPGRRCCSSRPSSTRCSNSPTGSASCTGEHRRGRGRPDGRRARSGAADGHRRRGTWPGHRTPARHATWQDRSDMTGAFGGRSSLTAGGAVVLAVVGRRCS